MPRDDFSLNQIERTPPANIEAEQALLGALLINNLAYERVVDIITPTDFHNAANGRIYAVIGRTIDRGERADCITLKNIFDQDGALVEIGGAEYLASLDRSAVTIINAEHYARVIRDAALRRSTILAAEALIEDAYRIDPEQPRFADSDSIETFDRAMLDVADGGTGRKPEPIAAIVNAALLSIERAYKNQGQITGITTGLIGLDNQIGGLQPTDLVIIAGRPSMGKTALAATGVALAASKAGHHSLIFSLEMSREQLAVRMMAALIDPYTKVSAEDLRLSRITREKFDAFFAAGEELSKLPLTIDDTAAASVAQLRARAIRYRRQHGRLDLIVVDYLQLIVGGKAENRVQEVSAITRGLKILAKDLQVPVIAVSQLSRNVEGRDNKRPLLADLRDSGSIEQDADIVLFVFREEYYLERAEPSRAAEDTDTKYNDRVQVWQENLDRVHGRAELIIAKNRHGETGNVKVRFDAARILFENLAKGETP